MPKDQPRQPPISVSGCSRASSAWGSKRFCRAAEEVLTADGLCVEDLGCESMRELCEQLGEFVKLTVFKKGYVYATVLANEEYDKALEALDREGAKTTGNKPWKRRARRKGTEAREAAPHREGRRAGARYRAGSLFPNRSWSPEPLVEPEPNPEPTPEPEPEPAPTPEQGTLDLAHHHVRSPNRPTEQPKKDRAQSDLPQDFYRDVRWPRRPAQQALSDPPARRRPHGPRSRRDFRVARSTGTVEGTRSNATFPLRYLQPDGVTPVRVSLRRSAKAVAGKRWSLVDGRRRRAGRDRPRGPRRGDRAARASGAAARHHHSARVLGRGAQRSRRQSRPRFLGTRPLRPARLPRAQRSRACRPRGLLGVSEDGSRAWFETGILAVEGKTALCQAERLRGRHPLAPRRVFDRALEPASDTLPNQNGRSCDIGRRRQSNRPNVAREGVLQAAPCDRCISTLPHAVRFSRSPCLHSSP